MSKVKYYYDSETLSYRKIEIKKGKKLGLSLLFLLAVMVTSIILLIIYLNIPNLETPKEKAYKRELQNMKLQYELLNRKMDQAVNVLEDLEDRDDNIYRVYFEANPISDEQRKAGFGGVNRYSNLEGFDNSELIIGTKQKLDQLTKRIVVHSKSLDDVTNLAENKEALLASIPAIQPIRNKDQKRMASGYGMRMDPIYKFRKMHNGMDFSAPTGTPVYATGNAKVKEIKRPNRSGGYGNLIVLDHGFGIETYYAHLDDFNVRRNQKVMRGEIIGYVGDTGKSTAPHLHYEVRRNGRPVNPINYYYNDLNSEEYEIMMNQASQENQSLD
ncbi:M23 family metallopeptidase [Psychroflexus planctonicus]|uniref:Peptidase M23 n=1 Tax=Psychroflexus planctonicus TaxID=1526575 RepID=A0ABQ1SCF0_9FLAO|nr:M23 family metallopeptidase [Psychroflexus planctonicus]GGE24864.1 peptidase M23 [Psychroflexus planctonicus]